MTKAKTAASSKGEAAVAISEVEDEARTFEWEGIKLELLAPSDVSKSYRFDLIDFQDAPSTVNLLRLVKRVLSPESYALVRSKFGEFDDAQEEEALPALLRGVFGAEPGE